MLLRELRGEIRVQELKMASEILLDEERCSKIFDRLITETFKSDEDGFEQLKKFLTTHGYRNDINRFLYKVKEYILKYGIEKLFEDYLSLNYIKEKVYNPIIRKEYNLKNAKYDINEVINEFSERFSLYSKSKYDLNSSFNPIGFIRQSFVFFIQSRRQDLGKLINEKGLLTRGGDGEIGLEIMSEMSVIETQATFDFKKDIKQIYESSKLLFSANSRTDGTVYMDLVSNYKIYKVTSKLDTLKDRIQNKFNPTTHTKQAERFLYENEFFIPIKVSRPESLYETEYRIGTYRIRNEISIELYKQIDSILTPELIRNIYETIWIIDGGSRSSKNKGSLFSLKEGDKAIYDKENRNKFMVLLDGLVSLRNLISYCNSKKINIFDIPTDIFRTNIYIDRFISLDDCLECYDITSALIKGASQEYSRQLYSNDEIYESIKSKPEFSFLSISQVVKNQLNNIATVSTVDMSKFFLWAYEEHQRVLSTFKMILKVCDREGVGTEVCDNQIQINEQFKSMCEKLVPEKYREKFLLYSFDEQLFSSYIRFASLRLNILKALCDLRIKTGANDRYELIQNLGGDSSSRAITKLPTELSSIQDLQFFNKVSDEFRLGSAVYDQAALNRQLKEFYSLVYDECKIGIDFVNKKIDSLVKDFSKNGIETELSSNLSPRVINASAVVYYSKELRNSNSSFTNYKSQCEEVHGYLFYGGKPVLIQSFYVHEYGYLVDNDGNIVSELGDNIKF
jgi:hypothetical protein